MVTLGPMLNPCWDLSVCKLAPLLPGHVGRPAFPQKGGLPHGSLGPVLPAIQTVYLFIYFAFFFFNVYSFFLRQRETEHEWGKVRERGRHRI